MRNHTFVRLMIISFIVVGALGVYPVGVKAAPDLAAGDIALILYNGDTPDGLAFVALDDIAAGEVVYFTDNGWLAAGGFRGGEGVVQWTAPAGGISAGTIIRKDSPFDTNGWSVVSGSLALAASGDQLLVYQGSGTPTFIYALNNEGTGWQADATDSNTSALPTGLINGTTAIALTEIDNARLNCSTAQSGTKAQLLAYISNPANWVGDDTILQELPAGCSFSVTATDDKPTVVSTLPADGVDEVAPDATLTVTFSEPVTVTGSWFDLTCTSSGSHTAAVSGGPEVFTLDPDTDFVYGDTCTLTIAAAQVADQDAPIENMVADVSVVFDVNDPAPTVVSTFPVADDAGVALNATLQITFSEPVTASGNWLSLSCSVSGNISGVFSGGPSIYTFDPAADFVGGESCTVTITGNAITDNDGNDPYDQMLGDYTFDFTAADCGGSFTRINAIQGTSQNIALTGVQTTEGVVTHLAPEMDGFFIESLVSERDADDATSEGLFVYDSDLADTLSVGDYVRLTGTTGDYSGSYGNMVQMSQLSSITESQVCTSGLTVVPTTLNLPITGDPNIYLERYEGMLVTIPQELTVQQNYFQGRFGQITLGSGGRIFNPHNGSGGDYTENIQRMIILDDSSSIQNPNPIPYYGVEGALRVGDTVTNIIGVLDQGRINSSNTSVSLEQVFPNVYYRLHPTEEPVFTQNNPRPVTAPELDGYLRVASFNVLNYFTTLDQPPFPAWWPYGGGTSPRGADSYYELIRQEDKLVTAITGLDADILGLVEIESWNNAFALQALIRKTNIALGANAYAVSGDPFNTTYDVIQQAFIYKPETVTPIGSPLILEVPPFTSYRPPLAQLFKDNFSGETFWVVVNHYKSKNCYGTETGGDLDAGDGIGCYNKTRLDMSTEIVDWVDNTLALVDADVLVIGDFNSYGGEPPIDYLSTMGLTNQIEAFVPAEDRYSYTYDGMSGYLGHAFTTGAMNDFVADAAIWHINSDEPSIIDYNTEFKTVDLYQVNPFRSSDHDPLIVGLDFFPLKYFAPLFIY